MSRILTSLFLLALPVAAQLNLAHVSQFTHPIFAGNGTIGVCTDSFTGDIWVVDFSNTINLHRFNVLGTLLSSHPTNTCTPSMTSPNDLTQDRNTGDLWLVDNDTPGKVLRFSTSGACLGGFTLGSAYSNPVSMVHHPLLGTLFIGHTGAVAQWTTSGTNLGTAFAVPMGSVIVAGLTYVPTTGNFLATTGGNQVYEISATGALISTTSLASYGITNIQGIDYDPFSGRIVVSDNSSVTIHIFQDLNAGTNYQVNQPGASLDVNGVIGTPTYPATVTIAVNQAAIVTFASTNLGALWELGLGSAPLKPASQGGLLTSDGQILNLDLADPSLLLVWNLFQSPPFVNLATVFSSPTPINLSAQMVVLDLSTPSGLRLSQPVRVIVQ